MLKACQGVDLLSSSNQGELTPAQGSKMLALGTETLFSKYNDAQKMEAGGGVGRWGLRGTQSAKLSWKKFPKSVTDQRQPLGQGRPHQRVPASAQRPRNSLGSGRPCAPGAARPHLRLPNHSHNPASRVSSPIRNSESQHNRSL